MLRCPFLLLDNGCAHRTARLNEISGRYSVMKDEFYLPFASDLRHQSQNNKQGRSEEALSEAQADAIVNKLAEDQVELYKHYTEMIDMGLAREVARVNLPLSLYTEWYWQIDLHNLFHFLRLRMDGHAQYEIRVYAEAMAKCAKAVAPIAYEAFEDHMLNAMHFSASELKALKDHVSGNAVDLEGRSLSEFQQKMEKLDLIAASNNIVES
jgi:thymidylate synthase (FAD)